MKTNSRKGELKKMSNKKRINIDKKRAELIIKKILLHNKNLIVEEPNLAKMIVEYLQCDNGPLSIVNEDEIVDTEEAFEKYRKIGLQYKKAQYDDDMAHYDSELEESRHEPPLFFI